MKKNNVKEIKVVSEKKVKNKKKRSIKIPVILTILVIALVTTVLVFSGLIINRKHNEALEVERVKVINKIADEFLKGLKEYEVDYGNEDLRSDGELIDLGRGEPYELSRMYPFVTSDFVDGYNELITVTDGKLFKDIDGSITVLSNIYIGDRYCIFEDDSFKCDKKYKKDTNIKKVDKEKEYKVGDTVTLSDGTTWRVIRDSGKYGQYVTLLSDNILYNASNVSYAWNFSPSMSNKYDKDEERNIAYYLDSEYNRLFNYEGLYESRLMSYDEYEDLDKEDETWFYNNALGQWMLYDYEDNNVYYQYSYESYYGGTRYSIHMMYTGNRDDFNYTLRPVITIRKDKIDAGNVNLPLIENTEGENELN